MANWNEVTITEQGEYLFSQGIAENKITITRIVSGSGSVPRDKLFEQTAITNPIVEGTVTRIATDNTGCTITISVSNEEITEPYELRQLGVYAKTESTSEMLYMIAQAEDPDTIPIYSEMPLVQTFNLYIAHSNALQVYFEKPATGLVTLDDINPLLEQISDKVDSHTNTSVFDNLNGVHGLRTTEGDTALQIYSSLTENWERVKTYDEPLSQMTKFL